MDTHAAPDRLAALHMRLLDETDSVKRAAIHLELATLSMSGGQFEQAGKHFREALHLDETLDVARHRLQELGVGAVRPRSRLRAWFSRRAG